MNEPKYILRTYESEKIPEQDTLRTVFRILVWAVIGILILGSIIFQESMLGNLSVTTRILLIMVAIGMLFWKKKYRTVATPIELVFFDDCMILFGNKRYYSKKLSRKEYNKFFYNGLKEIYLDCRTRKLVFIGKLDATWFDYINGVVSSVPTYHRLLDEGISWFYIHGNDENEIISCIEQYTCFPVKKYNDPEETKV